MARNAHFGIRDWCLSGGGAFSGGDWGSSLGNVTDPRPQFTATSVTNGTSDTRFSVDFGSAKRIGVFHFQNLVVESAATIRLKAGNDPTFATNLYDSTSVSAWPSDIIPAGSNYIPGAYEALGRQRIFVPPAVIGARYINVAIDNHLASTLTQIGCFCACDVWEPDHNFVYGASWSTVDDSDVQRIPGGTVYVNERQKRRRVDLGFDALPEDDATGKGFLFSLVHGRSHPVVVVPFPDTAASLERLSIYGRSTQDGKISNPFLGLYSQTFQIESEV